MHKKGPYILLGTLTIVLIFIVGVRYGQHVEKTNKVINYVLSITPSPTMKSVTPTPVVYQNYKSKKWGLTFTFPDNLQIKESATASAILFEVKK